MKERIIALVSDRRFQAALAGIAIIIIARLAGVNVPIVP